MKTNKTIRYILGFILVIGIGFLSHNIIAQTKQKTQVINDVDVKITIDSKTTESELSEITEMLAENNIESKFNNIERNDLGEIISIKIELFSGVGQTVAGSMENNMGIGEITFGRENGELYVGSDGAGLHNFNFFNMPNVHSFQFDNDSIMKHHFKSFGNFNFEDFFDDEENTWFGNLNDDSSVRDLIEKMRMRFGDSHGTVSGQKFRFVDDPNTEKLIIIDGTESDFETLNQLAKDDKLEAVDFLKSKTAISVYGSKAKDGAVIATTKTFEKKI